MAKLFNKDISSKIKEYHESQKLIKALQFPDLDIIFESIDTKGLDIFDINNVSELAKFYSMIRGTDTYHDAAIVFTNVKSNVIPLEILQHFCKIFMNIVWVKEGEETKVWRKSVKEDSDISFSESEEEPNLSFNDELDDYEVHLKDQGLSVEESISQNNVELTEQVDVNSDINKPSSAEKMIDNLISKPADIQGVSSEQNLESIIKQFQRMHTETLSSLATIKKTLVSQNLLMRQLSEKLTAVQTEVKTVNAVLPLIRPTHSSVLEKVHKY